MSEDPMGGQGVFVLCDAGAVGFPIQYASDGFVGLFGYSSAECVGRKCGALVGGPVVKADAAGLARVARASKLSPGEAERAVDALTRRAGEQCRSMMAGPEERVGFALVLNRTKGGAMLVCECIMLVLRHPEMGCHTLGFQRDVSREVPPALLLSRVAAGGLEGLVAERRVSLDSRLAGSGIGSIAQHLRNTAVGMRQAPQPQAPPAKLGGPRPQTGLRSQPGGGVSRREPPTSRRGEASSLWQIPEGAEEEAEAGSGTGAPLGESCATASAARPGSSGGGAPGPCCCPSGGGRSSLRLFMPPPAGGVRPQLAWEQCIGGEGLLCYARVRAR